MLVGLDIMHHPQAGTINYETADWLILDAVRYDNYTYVLDNRRLYCLKELQKHIGDDVVIQVRIRLHKWHSAFDKFCQHYTTINAGINIRVRWPSCRHLW